MSKKKLLWLKIFLGLGLVGALYYHYHHASSLNEALVSTDWKYLFLCFLLLPLNLTLGFLKWRFLLRKHYPEVRNREVWGSLLMGYTLGIMTPGNVGEMARSLFFMEKDRGLITGLNIMDKASNQLVFYTLGGVSLGILFWKELIPFSRVGKPLLIPGAIILFILWFGAAFPRKVQFVLMKIPLRGKFNGILDRVFHALDDFHRVDSAKLILWSFLWVMVVVLQYHVLVMAFSPVAFYQSFLSVTSTLFIKTLLPFSFGDLGIREGFAIFFYSPFSVNPLAVLYASLLIFFCNFLLPTIPGSYFLFRLQGEQQENNLNLASQIQLEETSTEPVNSEITDD